MHRFLLTVGFGLLLGASSLGAAFARPGPEPGASASTPRAVAVNHDRYRPHAAPQYQYHRPVPHWYRPAPYRYHPSYYHPRPAPRHVMPRGHDRGWR